MKKIIALLIILASTQVLKAQETYDDPLQQWLWKKSMNSDYKQLVVERTHGEDGVANFFMDYSIRGGHFITAIMFNQSIINYEYDDEGGLIKETFTIPGGIVYTTTHSYNEKGYRIATERTFKAPDKAEAIVDKTTTYEYNEQGLLIKSIIKEAEEVDGGETTTVEFAYNDGYQLVEVKSVKVTSDETYTTVDTYTYNKLNVVTSKKSSTTTSSGEELESTTTTYTYNSDNVTETVTGRGTTSIITYTWSAE